ncbi:MAG: ABC transporter substrate-binding protein [Deltaproteobacteria bacterium]|jgi:iron complex transport system substrate-binding protein|nr:ABC transporter substrate-binding protein [Deltaproteobacteria bacterium]
MMIFNLKYLTLLGLFIFLLGLFQSRMVWSETLEIRDSRGRLLTVSADPGKVVALSLTSLEIICLLGQSHRIAAATNYMSGHANQFPFLGSLPKIGDAFNPNLEVLVKLQPDLLITWVNYPGPELERRLEPFGIDILRFNFTRPDRLQPETRTLAKIFGSNALVRAIKYADFCQKHENSIKERIKVSQLKPTLVIEHVIKNRVATATTGISNLARILEAKNFGDAFTNDNSTEVDSEWFVRRNPSHLVRDFNWRKRENESERRKMAAAIRAEILGRPGWQNIEAIKNQKVLVIDLDLTEGARYVLGLYKMAHFLYPDIVAHDEWRSVETEYRTKFLDNNN